MDAVFDFWDVFIVGNRIEVDLKVGQITRKNSNCPSISM
jgi:hypothetical protein